MLSLRVSSAVAVLLFAACSDDPKPEEQVLPPVHAQRLQLALDEAIENNVAPGLEIAVDHPRYALFSASAGFANISTKQSFNEHPRFAAGSILKTLIATAMLQQVEAGALSLDAKLEELLPTDITMYVPNAAAITVRMLLNHTSGIAEFADDEFDAILLANPQRRWTLTEQLERAAVRTPSFAPGAGWSYSNTNYVLLGAILEAETGGDWRRSVETGVLEPAGMNDTDVRAAGETACVHCARGYELVNGELIDATDVDPSMAGASGGATLVTTPEDLIKFVQALVAGKLFTHASTWQLMQEFVETPIPEEATTGYGMGLVRFQVGDVEMYGHLGGTAGYQAFMMIDPKSGLTLTGAMNVRGDLGAFVLPVLEAALAIE